MTLPLIVGFDGSDPSLAAAEWAATEATLTGAPVRLALAHWPHRDDVPVPDAYVQLRDEAVDLLKATVQGMRGRHLGLRIDYELLPGDAPTQLLRAAESGSTLVLGSRGTGGFAGLLLGSTALAVTARAEHPVVLVREDAEPEPPRHEIVLGLRLGKGERTSVITFALAEAERHATSLRVVHAQQPARWWTTDLIPPGEAQRTALRRDAEERLRDALRPLAAQYPHVRVSFDVRTGTAAHVLVEAADHAALLVLGRRRRGTAPALGPAVHAAVHYRLSPVAIVPHA
ncbi:universal stress protein [Streptacidiphilus neutrinimicus]|uniref:universal stress protein n=1 Tax=Streptacidiphilus neutrinimicus TaxID=105420 RepID=UPI0005AAB1FD|nr:universal stress protein [Streptacidiphilus neutrinimicus]